MQEIRSLNPPVVTWICDPNKSWAQHHRSLKLGSKLKYLNIISLILAPKTFWARLYSRSPLESTATVTITQCSAKQRIKGFRSGRIELKATIYFAGRKLPEILVTYSILMVACEEWVTIVRSDLLRFMLRISVVNKSYTGITRIFNSITVDQWMRSDKNPYTTPHVT